MADQVFDSSALIAYFNDEPGAHIVEAALAKGGMTSAVNWTEVLTKVSDAGVSPQTFAAEIAERGILGQLLEIVPFDERHAASSAELRAATRAHGLSLGDRACLALAQISRLPVYTTDRAWGKLDVGVEVFLIR